MSYQAPLGYIPISSSAPRLLGAAYIPILLSEVEQELRPSGNGNLEQNFKLNDSTKKLSQVTGNPPRVTSHLA